MTQSTKNKIPGPVYAAAGASDLAYRQLRKLPAVLSGLTGKAAAGTADLREKAVMNSAELRDAARRNAAAFVAGAQVAQEKATAVYEELVARGARVIGGSADTVSADAELESEGAVAPALAVGPEAPVTAKPVKKATRHTPPVDAQ
jgi:heparin binding hemagglutinin HbhA